MFRELTPPAILRQFNQTGRVPEQMLPLQGFAETLEDPTKPLRGAFEGILLARATPVAFQAFSLELTRDQDKPWIKWNMIPVAEIDEEEELYNRIGLLDKKREYVMNGFSKKLRQALMNELDEKSQSTLPPRVAYAYEKLTGTDTPEQQVEGIMTAADSFRTTVQDLFRIAGYDYPITLGYDPSARQIVKLVSSSYQTYVHPQTGIHIEVSMGLESGQSNLGEKYLIDCSGEPHKVFLINPSQYQREEKELRKTGEIKDQKIHCPFAMRSQSTAPFLTAGTQPSGANPLQHTFETLIVKYIGS